MKRIILLLISLFLLFGCMETIDYKQTAKNMELPQNVELKERTLRNIDDVVVYMIFRLYDGYTNIDDISDKAVWKKTGETNGKTTDVVEVTYMEAKVRVLFTKDGDMYYVNIADLFAQKGGKKYSGLDLIQEVSDIKFQEEMNKLQEQSEKEYNKIMESIK